MRLSYHIALYFSLLVFPWLVSAAVLPRPLVRKEWRSLTRDEKASYISAVHCMLRKPPRTSKTVLPGVQNRFEDFLGDHIQQALLTHYGGHFCPYHRLLLWTYEREILACGFTGGGQPYWDWSLDANNNNTSAAAAAALAASPIFDPNTGFGGNGAYVPGNTGSPEPGIPVTARGVPFEFSDRSGGGCIRDGPFANLMIHMGPGPSVEFDERCVRRDFVPSVFVKTADAEEVAAAMGYLDFGTFSRETEATVHNAGHLGVGGLYGVLADPYASPGDPLFFLHHANMDRLWWSWQSRDLSVRLKDISGPFIAYDWSNEKGRNVTLDDAVHVGTTWNITRSIRDLMDIRHPNLGYVYETLY